MAQNNSNGKLTAQNTFEGGMVSDLHVMASPSNTVRHALNMELVTIGEDQYIFQNIRGNSYVVDIGPDYTVGATKYKFTPLGVKVHNNIAYIIAGAFGDDGEFKAGMIGTFPSPNWDKLNAGEPSALFQEFKPLHNYKPPGSDTYTNPFVSDRFSFEKNRHLDIEIQGDFDSSVNIIFSDNINNPGIINSRFKILENNNLVYLADRDNSDDSNTYSDLDWDRISLVQNTNKPITVESFEIKEGGYLRGGGYRYYFKYATQEGNTTDLLYESPLIPISNGSLGLDKEQVSDKKLEFIVKDFDRSYAGIKVYFVHFDGIDTLTTEAFALPSVFKFSTGIDELIITHTGLEAVETTDIEDINTVFTPLDTARSITIISDRLAIAGITSTLNDADIKTLRDAALGVTLWQKTELVNKSYNDANTAAGKVGYWKGETYEFAIVFLLTNKGVSPAFPVTGMDNGTGAQYEFESSTEYPEYELGDSGFSDDGLLINNKGIFRTSFDGTIYSPGADGVGTRHVTYIEATTGALKDNGDLAKISSGFIIVRRERIKNVLMQGMMVPTLRVPTKYPSLSEGVREGAKSGDMSKRFLMHHYYKDNPTLGLNAKYASAKTEKGVDIFNIDFDTAFVPQPTQLINTITFDKSWIVYGGIGQSVTNSEVYGKTITRTGEDTKKMHLAFMSAEMDINFAGVVDFLSGIDPQLEIQLPKKVEGGLRSPLGVTSAKEYKDPISFVYSAPKNPIIKIVEPVRIDRAEWVTIDSSNVTAYLVEAGNQVFTKNGFTSKLDRAFGFFANTERGAVDDTDDSNAEISYGIPFFVRSERKPEVVDTDYLNSSARVIAGSVMDKDVDFYPYSLVTNSYSTYLGLEIDSVNSENENLEIDLPTFHYKPHIIKSLDTQVPLYTEINRSIKVDEDQAYVNVGHLANVFRSSTGRWGEQEIRDIYKYDSNDQYFAVTDRTTLLVDNVSIFRGDCFISKISKRVSYKNGVPEAESATQADSGIYGIGIVKKRSDETDAEKLADENRYDEGRNLLDVGQIIEIATQTNINADIRSLQSYSSEETSIYNGPRDFYPHKKDLFGEARPDSNAYNKGYTGDEQIVTYSRIEEDAPIFNTSFPNRILLSERNLTQNFFNSFRDLKGFNYRDYGVELGPIIKIVSIKNLLLSVHPGGILAIGVDDKTLVAEGGSVFVNTAEALSPTSKTISDVFGSTNPESIVKTEMTVVGVDYSASAVWVFEGNKISVISEFAIKTILESFKDMIDADPNMIPRVYSTYNFNKHLVTIAYVSENSSTKTQTHVGSVTYNTSLQKWSSKLSEGHKFSMSIGSNEYTTGFTQSNGAVNGIWKEDSLFDTSDDQVRCNFRGIQYGYEFEFTINNQPSAEKILDNIMAITNKVTPSEIIYTVSGDITDASEDIWGALSKGEYSTTQEVMTRNKSTRKASRLGILDQNAYYKNSNLYIEVGKRGSVSRSSESNRRIRDKNIKVKFVYTGSDPTFIQAIISMLSISYS